MRPLTMLAALLALALPLAACGADPPVADQSEVGGAPPADTAPPAVEREPVPSVRDYAQQLLAVDDVSLASLRRAFGEPRQVQREAVTNRHDPGQTDTILTVAYPGATFRLYQITGGRTLPEHGEVKDPRFLRWQRPTIGTPVDSVVAWWGEPLRREGGTLTYEDGGPVSTPLYLHTRDGRITSIEREYYLD